MPISYTPSLTYLIVSVCLEPVGTGGNIGCDMIYVCEREIWKLFEMQHWKSPSLRKSLIHYLKIFHKNEGKYFPLTKGYGVN